MKLLYLLKRECPDIQLAVSFLCSRVRYTSAYYYKKLSRVIKYIQGTIGVPLILLIDKSGSIKWYVDAAYAVYKDMKSHTDGFMNMGTLVVYVQYR